MAKKSTRDTRSAEVNAIYTKPRQKVPFSKKIENNYAWAKDCINYFAKLGTTDNFMFIENHQEQLEMYQWYNNNIPEKYFHHIKNPLNTSKEDFKNFPAKIRPYSIVRPAIDLLMGEYRKRPFSYNVNVNNPDAINKMQEKEYETILQKLEEYWMRVLKDTAQDTELANKIVTPEQPQQEQGQQQGPNLEEDLAKFKHNYKDERAIQGQYAMDYVVRHLHIVPKLAEMFKDWLLVGKAYSYKNVYNEEIFYDRINPLLFTHDSSTQYAEDGEWACYRTFVSLSELVDMFYDELSPEDIDELDVNYYGGSFNYAYNVMNVTTFDQPTWVNRIPLVHCCWKAFKKVGILTYIDEYGQPQEMEVPEEYKAKKEKGETIEWYWVTEAWEGYRAASNFYLRIRPIPAQRNKMNLLSACKLPYNGRRYSNTNDKNTSIMELCLPYQILYITIIYMMELTLAKNKGKILLIDKNVIPSKGGWTTEQFMYYAEALGYGFVDRSNPHVDKSFNQYAPLDMSTLQHVGELIQTAEYVKQMLNNMMGISPQREGKVEQGSTVGATDKAIYQSNIISEELFAKFDEFVQRELTGILDISKLAWRNGKKAMFIGSDMRTQILEIDPNNYVNADFGVTISNSSKDKDVLDNIKQMSQAFAQNGQVPSTILEVLKAENISSLSSILKQVEEKQMQMAQQAQQSEQQQAEQELNVQMMLEKLRGQLEIDKINAEYDRKERIELIKGDVALTTVGGDTDGNGVLDINEVENRALEREKVGIDAKFRTAELMLKQKEIDTKQNAAVLKAQTDVYKADTQLKVAKQNKNKYDK
jgi:hypothetical protein